MSEATIEVDGEVYALTHAAIRGNTQTYTGSRGERYAMKIGPNWLEATTSDARARALVHKGALRCCVEVGGLAYTGHAQLMGWSPGFSEIRLVVEGLEPIPATPALDETTDPADLDWGAIRSACDRRDWREAWGVVGTDHTGDATPGEVYLLSVARHKSATAAALWHWRQAEKDLGTIFLGADAARAWQRIKGIAAWESSARAQYVKRTPRDRYNIDMEGGSFQQEYQGIPSPQIWMDARADWAQRVRLYGRDNAGDALDALRQLERATQADGATVRPTDMWIDEATFDALRQRSEDDALTRDGRGVVGVLNNPYLSAAAQRGEVTGTLTITARDLDDAAHLESELRRQLGALIGQPTTQATRVRAERIAANVLRDAQRTANPAPRGPQAGRRRR